ncbi:MAG: DUF72 domain-containing protein [Myxococcota bacterium]
MSEKASDGLFGSGQLGLFGGAPKAEPGEGLTALGAALPPWMRMGTSSWTFPGWEGLVYQRSYGSKARFLRESLAEYARYPLFRTVGIDRSYYAPLEREELQRYASQLPDDFRCVSKVWSEITTRIFPRHHKRAGQVNARFLDPELFRSAFNVYGEAFAAHAGPFVVEIPPAAGPVNAPGFARSVDRFLTEIDGKAPAPFGFELRDRRLFSARYLEILRAHGATHVFNAWSQMPAIRTQLQWTGGLVGPVLVARLMLPPQTKYEDLKARFAPFDRIIEPQPAMRADALQLFALAAEATVPAYMLVNNKAEGSSPKTVEALARAWLERDR